MRHYILHKEDGTSVRLHTDIPQMDRERGERRQAAFKDGDRVRLVALAQSIDIDGTEGYDDRRFLPLGTEGTVRERAGAVVDGGGSLFVEWDNGSGLMAMSDDRVLKLDDPDAEPI